jgi:hypothetical protein
MRSLRIGTRYAGLDESPQVGNVFPGEKRCPEPDIGALAPTQES